MTPLPNFLIVGAAKSGTTSLYGLLSQHPSIFMPEIKEPSYFVAPEVANRIPTCVTDESDYERLFADGADVRFRGEASVLYLFFYQQAIPRILANLGNETRILMVLRNPVDRAYSAYFDSQRFDINETLTFEQALAQEDQRKSDPTLSPMMYYQSMGFYADSVAAYKQAFPKTEVLLFEDLLEPETLAQRLGRFFDLDPSPWLQTLDRSNEGGKYWSNPVMARLVKGAFPPALRRGLANLAPGVHGRLKRFAVSRLMDKTPEMSTATRDELIQLYGEDVARLQSIVQRDLSGWLTP